MIDISKLLDSISRVGPKTIFPIAIAAGTILFAPVSIMETLYLTFLRDNYGAWVGGIFVIACSLLLMSFCCWIVTKVNATFDKRSTKKVRHKYLKDLTPDERGFLEPYVFDEVTTRQAEICDGVVSGLDRKGIVYRPSTVGTEGLNFAYNIQPWARDHLKEHPELLQGASIYPPPRRDW